MLLFTLSYQTVGQCAKDCSQQEACFEKLFDGKSTIGWRGYQKDHVPAKWVVADGTLHFDPSSEGDRGDIIFEMQVLDNERHPDAKLGNNGNRKAGSLYDLIPAVPQNCNPAGEWNQAEVIHKDGHVIHMQNGEKVVEYQVGSDEWKELVAGSKFPGLNPDWANLASEGYIGFQDHGNEVWFRNIQIMEL